MYDWGVIASADETTFLTQAIGLADRPNWQGGGRPGEVFQRLDSAAEFLELWT